MRAGSEVTGEGAPGSQETVGEDDEEAGGTQTEGNGQRQCVYPPVGNLIRWEWHGWPLEFCALVW